MERRGPHLGPQLRQPRWLGTQKQARGPAEGGGPVRSLPSILLDRHQKFCFSMRVRSKRLLNTLQAVPRHRGHVEHASGGFPSASVPGTGLMLVRTLNESSGVPGFPFLLQQLPTQCPAQARDHQAQETGQNEQNPAEPAARWKSPLEKRGVSCRYGGKDRGSQRITGKEMRTAPKNLAEGWKIFFQDRIITSIKNRVTDLKKKTQNLNNVFESHLKTHSRREIS